MVTDDTVSQARWLCKDEHSSSIKTAYEEKSGNMAKQTKRQNVASFNATD